MECNEESRTLHRQAFEQHEFILGDSPGVNEFISPDLETSFKEENDIDIKDEPNNLDEDDILVNLDYDESEIKAEAYSPETKTENDPADMPQYGCSVNIPNNENSCSYILGPVHPNDETVQTDEKQTVFQDTAPPDERSTVFQGTTQPDETSTLFQSTVQPEKSTGFQYSTVQNFGTSGTAVISAKTTNDLVPRTRGAAGGNAETILVSDIQQSLPGSSGTQTNFSSVNQDVHILALISGPPPLGQANLDPEEEVQVQVSNKWIESRGDNYVNLSILTGFPNPQVTKSISLTREGIQIFIHKLPLKTTHSIWNILGSSTAIEKGQSLSTIANRVEKMKVCTGCWDQKCREIWEEGVFGERGFVEVGFSPSPVYRTFECQLLIDRASRSDACYECRGQWTNMIRVINKKRRKENEPRDLDKINYKFLTKTDMENALRETRKEASKYRKQITMLHKEIDGLLGAERGRRNSRLCNDEIIIINDKFT